MYRKTHYEVVKAFLKDEQKWGTGKEVKSSN
jgi:hypothetical protein